MNKEERIQHNMKELRLTRRQVEIHDILMSSNISTFPKSLTDFLTALGDKYMMCGAAMAEGIAAWIAERESELLGD